MKINVKDIPVSMESNGATMRMINGYGGMAIGFNKIPAGLDVTPLLKGLKNDSCHCAHWGYIFEGVMRVIYDDGTKDLLTKGDAFYLPPGHTAIVEEDLLILDFNPEKEFGEVMEHMAKKMEEMNG